MTDEPNNPIDEPLEAGVTEQAATDAPPAAEEAAVPAEAEAETTAEAEAAVPADAEAETTAEAEAAVPAEPEPTPDPEPTDSGDEADDDDQPEEMEWYILKVQSNREDSIRDGLVRRVAIAGLDDCFGEIIVPTEKVTEFKGGKKRVMKRKLYPGYLVVQMVINDDTWFLVRETPGIGDFTGAAGTPTPMMPHEVARIVARAEEKTDEAPKLQIGFKTGDRVKINEGTFDNFEGEVNAIDETSGRVTVMINIFGRSTPVELEYWQIEAV